MTTTAPRRRPCGRPSPPDVPQPQRLVVAEGYSLAGTGKEGHAGDGAGVPLQPLDRLAAFDVPHDGSLVVPAGEQPLAVGEKATAWIPPACPLNSLTSFPVTTSCSLSSPSCPHPTGGAGAKADREATRNAATTVLGTVRPSRVVSTTPIWAR